MRLKFSIFLALICWLAMAASAQTLPLKPGQSTTVSFSNLRLLEKGTPPVVFRDVSAQVNFALDEKGTVLTITARNTSLASAAAMLYAVDVGLPQKLLNQARLEVVESSASDRAVWLGPTDNAGPTAGTGSSTFAARGAVLGRMEDFLDAQLGLPEGFLAAGQEVQLALALEPSTGMIEVPLLLRPVAYFLVPDSKLPKRRIRLAAESFNRAGLK